MKINKAVILAGGRGTRFLPYTKAVCKELIAVADIPAIELVVDECVLGGIKDILIIISPQKQDLKRYFERDTDLENFLLSKGKKELYEQVKAIGEKANISYAVQEEAGGTGHALLLAESFCGKQPAVVLNGDDYIYTGKDATVVAQLIESFEKYPYSTLGVQEVTREQISKYASCEIVQSFGRSHHISAVYEKPKEDKFIKSLLAPLGRYVISADFFPYLKDTKPAANGELQFTDALLLQAQKAKVFAYEFTGKRYDLGDKFGYLQAVVEFSLRHKELGKRFKEYLSTLNLQNF